MLKLSKMAACIAASSILLANVALADRIGDLTTVSGDRQNQLQGYGIVSGLQGTGDRGSAFTNQSLQSLIERYGIRVPDNVNINSRNSAFVMVQGSIGAYDSVGSTIDVTLSSVGNANSLRGGTLSSTALRGLDGEVYAVAQGPIIVDGVSAEGLDGSSITVNTTGVGYIPDGATIEREVGARFSGNIRLNLNNTNYQTNANIVERINETFGDGTARTLTPNSIEVTSPEDATDRVMFLSMITNLEVERGDDEASVIINSRTGTVVISHNVTLRPAAISEGRMVINISEDQEVSQPNSLAGGQTQVTSNSEVRIESTRGQFEMVESSATLQDLVNVLNAVGTDASDMVHIMHLLKRSGALNARIVVL